jgi:hypothetical protein
MATIIKREGDDNILPEEILSSNVPPCPREDDGDTLPGEIVLPTPPPPPGQATASEINIDNLVPNKPKHELKSRFPPGCPMWYSIGCSSSSFSSSNEHLSSLESCYGMVKAIFINLLLVKRIYKVKSNMIGNDKVDQHYFLLEEQLAFATNCHVKVKMMMGKDEPDTGGLEGVILCPHWSPSSNIHDENILRGKYLTLSEFF